MPLENANTINELNPAWPTGNDPVSEGDDHIRQVKQALLNSFPGLVSIANSWGWVDADGTILGGSGDFTVTKNGPGWYQLNFSTAATSQFAQSMTANAVGLGGFANGAVCNVAANDVDLTRIDVQIVLPDPNQQNQVYVDQAFTFIRNAL